ncbi:Cna B-type domain-containing protein, partial [Streptococcus pacificus]
YSVTEDAVDGYTTTIDGFDVTNTHKPSLVSIKGTKTWDDADNQDGIRPESITLTLLADGKATDQTVTVSEKTNWTYEFTDLPEFKDGQKIVYSVTEEAVKGYETTIDGFDVTNTHTPSTTKVVGKKTWDDADNKDGLRPESITVRLYANGKEVKHVVVTAKDKWSYRFENLPEYENGKKIEYSLSEDAVKGYTTVIKGYDITNVHHPEKPLPKTGESSTLLFSLVGLVVTGLAGIFAYKRYANN